MLFDNVLDIDADEELEHIEPSSSDNEPEDTGPSDAELRALGRGWVPKDEYRGRPEDWQDADSFLERNASLQRDVKELNEKLAQRDEEYAERLKRIETANERIIIADREKMARELEREKRLAVQLGDEEEYDRVRAEEAAYYKRIVEDERALEAEREPRQRKADLLPETQDWIRRNSWFNEKPAMQQIALGFYSEALEGMPANKDESKRLAYVEKKMATVYPDQFGSGNKAGAVEGGRRLPANNRIVDLKPEEVAAMNSFIKRGIIKDKAEYIRLLNEE